MIGKELTGLETLEAKQLVTTTKLMSLRREGARLKGERSQMLASAASSRGKIAEIEVQRLGIDHEAKSEVLKELRESEGKIAELSERRTAAEDQLKRIEMRSPVDGVVHQMSVFTVGGVVNTAEPLMLIVPEGDKLVIEGWLERIERVRFWCAFKIIRLRDNTVIADCRQMLALIEMPAGKLLRLPESWEKYREDGDVDLAGAAKQSA